MIKQIKKGYLELPGFVFKQDELVNIAKSINVEKDDCISIPSGETHWQENP